MRSKVSVLMLAALLAGPALGCLPIPVAVTVPVAPAPAPIYGPGFEVNVDRPGNDYRNFDLPAPQPDICRNACFNDPTCVAFTYVNPGVQGPNARCWLKNAVPPPAPNSCCVSGVKFAGGPPPVAAPPPPRRGAFEPGINRCGDDYRSFDLPAPEPEICRRTCYAEPACLAFTYVNPGVQGPNARCWLKSRVPAPTPDSCCVSGVK